MLVLDESLLTNQENEASESEKSSLSPIKHWIDFQKLYHPQDCALTGDRPSGPLHLGHYVGSLLNRIQFQDVCPTYIMIADLQALSDHVHRTQWVRQSVEDVVKDYLAAGIDPNKSTIFLQSQVPELVELSFYFMNLVSVSRLYRNPTLKHEIQQKGFGENVSAGFLCYPISQAADIAAFGHEASCVWVPVGEDQIPMIEQTNEIVRKFNGIYGKILSPARAILSGAPRLVGIDGKNKASKSLNNAIFLKDTDEILKQKVFNMYTDPQHIHVNQPGCVEGNVVFEYLSAFDPNSLEVENLKENYRAGGLGDVTLKKRLFAVLRDILEPMRQRREAIKDTQLREILMEGSGKARQHVQKTLAKVRHALGLMDFL